MALLALQPLAGGVMDPRWLVALRGLVAAALLAFFWRSFVELRNSPPVRAREWLLAIAVGLVVFGLWITFDSGWMAFDSSAEGFVPLRPDGTLDWTLVAVRLFGLVLVVPLMEELFWRSFLLRWIGRRDFLAAEPRKAGFLAVTVTCALFATEHSLWFAGLLAGAAYTWLYMRAGNLWLPIVSHATTNGTLGLWILATGNWRHW